ncbi:tetratricopeptide repeat protein [Massilia yuzhufengensis]|uniref:TPR repeat-containing protein n=1 Tax=Massilia yuzhufengensis TaxID=1164594 RepID=A0A1I1DNG3_9BURK|nr:tetratricopeptide repeat protein [Massilia yuzhufengensis]SFB74598.1 TPR repeat-containing protein [Massilia yuzhufengensis]
MKIIVLAIAAALALPSTASAREFCGKLENHYGPYDYRTEKGKLPIVDGAHFTEEVEAGIRGATDELGGDLDYTLRAFPNHHRALATLSRVALRDKVVMIPKTKWPVECYFLRAQRLAPNDAVVYNLYGAYLSSKGQRDEALAQYKEAIRFDPDNAMFNYNIGLAYLKKNDYEKALYHAHKAYDQRYPLPGLKNQLIKAGKWKDKPAEETPAENKPVEETPAG